MSVQAFWRLPENEQDVWRERFDRDLLRCPHCGNSREDCSDPERVWYPQLTLCYATRDRVAAQRRWETLHKDRMYHDGKFARWAKEPGRATPYHLLDGATVWVSQTDLGLGGDFLDGGSAAPGVVGHAHADAERDDADGGEQ